MTQQVLNYMSGTQSQLDATQLAEWTAVGAGTGLISGWAWQGVNSGSNSFNAIYKQMVTKFENGQIQNLRLQTAPKMFMGRGWDQGFFQGTAVVGFLNGIWRDMWGRGCGN
jgi:hypothetical protein